MTKPIYMNTLKAFTFIVFMAALYHVTLIKRQIRKSVQPKFPRMKVFPTLLFSF